MGYLLKDTLYLSRNRFMYRRLYFIGFAAYVIMFILSSIFYKERTIFLDAAFNLFYIIKNKSFCIQLYRFGDVFNQLLPVIATKSGLPVNLIFRSYSVAFVIYYFFAYIICGSVLKRYDFALVILLLNILFVTDTFYWMQNQLPQASALLIIIFSLVAGKKFDSINLLLWSVLLTIEITVIFFHPLAIFVLIFSLFYFHISEQSFIDKKTLYTIAFIYIAGIAVKTVFFRSHYEGSAISGIKNFYTLFPDYITLFSNERFVHNWITKYYYIPILFFSITAYYFQRKERKKISSLFFPFRAMCY